MAEYYAIESKGELVRRFFLATIAFISGCSTAGSNFTVPAEYENVADGIDGNALYGYPDLSNYTPM